MQNSNCMFLIFFHFFPQGSFNGKLSSFSAQKLGALAVKSAIERAGVSPSEVEECILGNVLSAGLGQAPAR
jgi:acetyl-CoA C-acetyltransferase